jgi:hypothetical protein
MQGDPFFFWDGMSGFLLRPDKHYQKKIACPHAANLTHGCMLELVAVAKKKMASFLGFDRMCAGSCGQRWIK